MLSSVSMPLSLPLRDVVYRLHTCLIEFPRSALISLPLLCLSPSSFSLSLFSLPVPLFSLCPSFLSCSPLLSLAPSSVSPSYLSPSLFLSLSLFSLSLSLFSLSFPVLSLCLFSLSLSLFSLSLPLLSLSPSLSLPLFSLPPCSPYLSLFSLALHLLSISPSSLSFFLFSLSLSLSSLSCPLLSVSPSSFSASSSFSLYLSRVSLSSLTLKRARALDCEKHYAIPPPCTPLSLSFHPSPFLFLSISICPLVRSFPLYLDKVRPFLFISHFIVHPSSSLSLYVFLFISHFIVHPSSYAPHNARAFVCVCVCACVCARAYPCIFVNIREYSCIFVHIRACSCMGACLHACVHVSRLTTIQKQRRHTTIDVEIERENGDRKYVD